MNESCCTRNRSILILACAGSANVGQMTNQVAVELTQEGFGHNFCLAGIAAHHSGFIRSALDADGLIVMDGCSIGCAKNILEHIGIPFQNYFTLTEMGIEKVHGKEPARDEIDQIKAAIHTAMPTLAGAALPIAPIK